MREQVGRRDSGERFSGEASASLQPDRCGGLFLPPLDVHAEHKEPEHQQSFRDHAKDFDGGGQVVCDRR